MKLNKFAYLYSKPLGNHTLKIMKKYLEIYFKTLKYHGILSVRKSGNPEYVREVSQTRSNLEFVKQKHFKLSFCGNHSLWDNR